MDLTQSEPAAPLSILLRPAAVPFGLGLLLAAGCYWAAGPTLGLWLGGLVVVALLVPVLTLAEEGWFNGIIAGGSVVDGVAVVWLVALFISPVGFLDWLRCYVLLAAWAAAVWGVVILLEHLVWTLNLRRWMLDVQEGERGNVQPSTSRVQRRTRNAVIAAALTILLSLAWLTWPVWLSPWLTGTGAAAVVNALVPVHPPMAMNGVLPHLGIWGQHPIAYQLTTLGQDIPYALPRGTGWSALLHVMIAAAAIALARMITNRRER